MTPTASELVPWVVWASVLVLCALVDALFSGLETGIYVMNKHRLDLHAEANLPAAEFIERLLRKPNELLAVLLIGTNLSRYLATFAISAMFVLAGHEARAELYTLLLATPLLRDVTSILAGLPRAGRGSHYRPARIAERPLELYSFEASPFCRLVREVLCTLELPYRLHNVARGSRSREAFAQRSGRMRVPYLIDPNTGSEMFESADIVRYLEQTYAE